MLEIRGCCRKFPQSASCLLWLSVYRFRVYQIDFGNILVPSSLQYPRPQKINALSTLDHGVKSDRIVVVDAQTFLIPNFHYDGSAPGGYNYRAPETNGRITHFNSDLHTRGREAPPQHSDSSSSGNHRQIEQSPRRNEGFDSSRSGEHDQHNNRAGQYQVTREFHRGQSNVSPGVGFQSSNANFRSHGGSSGRANPAREFDISEPHSNIRNSNQLSAQELALRHFQG